MVHCLAFGRTNKKEAYSRGVSFFRLPKDVARRRAWLARCRLRDTPSDSDNVRLCSEHFALDCFVRDLRSELGFKKAKPQLKADAMPSVFTFSRPTKPRSASVIYRYSSLFIAIHRYSSLFIAIHRYSSLFIAIHRYSSLFIAIDRYRSLFIAINRY